VKLVYKLVCSQDGGNIFLRNVGSFTRTQGVISQKTVCFYEAAARNFIPCK